MKPLPSTLQRYVDHIAAAGIEGARFTELLALTPRYNGFRHLEKRRLIVNITPGYARDEPYTGPRTQRFVLSTFGLAHVRKR